MRKSAGFTLIELVIVIIILGILGAVAAPRLFNLQGDAYGANLSALRSSISTAATMANAKAQISGEGMKESGNGNVPEYEGIEFIFGYPKADKTKPAAKKGTGEGEADSENAPELNNKGILATLDGFEYDRYTLNETDGKLTITPTSIDAFSEDDDGCVVIYTQPTKAGEAAKVEAFTKGC